MESSGEPGNPANQPAPSQGMQEMPGTYVMQQTSVTFKLKCIWLFILGAVLALVGVYCLINRPDIGSNSFVIMLMGLMFTAVGSIYGKRKLSGQAATANYVVDPQQMLMVRPEPAPQVQPEVQPAQPAASPGQPMPQISQGRVQSQPVPSQPAEEKPSEIRKIFVCPKCGAENEMEDKFCYKCGFKFSKPKKRAAKTAKKPAGKARQSKKAKTKPDSKEAEAATEKPGKKKRGTPEKTSF